ncbi:hypothetical protein GCM10010442_37760 [Kitasatospora kifunensis]
MLSAPAVAKPGLPVAAVELDVMPFCAFWLTPSAVEPTCVAAWLRVGGWTDIDTFPPGSTGQLKRMIIVVDEESDHAVPLMLHHVLLFACSRRASRPAHNFRRRHGSAMCSRTG